MKAVILAAGKSTRFNGIKQLAEIGERALINHVTNQAIDSDLDEIMVVLGYEKNEIKKSLNEFLDNDRNDHQSPCYDCGLPQDNWQPSSNEFKKDFYGIFELGEETRKKIIKEVIEEQEPEPPAEESEQGEEKTET